MNGNIAIIGLGCCKKNGITEIATNLVLLEFLTETYAGSLVLKNGSFDINNDIDFITFINTKLLAMNTEKENLEFYIRKLEILKKNIVELMDVYHFYSGETIVRNIDDIFLNFNPLKNINDILLDFEDTLQEVPTDVVQEVPTEFMEDDIEEILAKRTVKFTMDKILIQLENPEDTYKFRDPSLNELCRRADNAFLKMKLNNCEYEYLYFQMNHSLQKICNK